MSKITCTGCGYKSDDPSDFDFNPHLGWVCGTLCCRNTYKDNGVSEARSRLKEKAQNEATVIALSKLLTATQEELKDIKETYKNIVEKKCAGDEKHCSCVPALRAEIERLQLQLAACGVAAQCNTTESAAKNRIDKRNIYWSASYSDVCSAVDREMLLREKLASVTKAAKDLIAEIGKYSTRQPLCDTNIHWFKRLLREACE